MIDEEFLFAIGYNDRIADGPLVYITPKSYWNQNNAIAEAYSDDQYAILYSMTEEVELEEIMEGVYQAHHYINPDDLEWTLEQAGFIKDEEFIMYVEDTEFF